jgi:hypothetical protein
VNPIDGRCDSLFICCSSYEERSTLGVRKLSPQYRANYSLICVASEYAEKGKGSQYYEEINRRLGIVCDHKPKTQKFQITDSIGFVRATEEEISRMHDQNPLCAVTIDISTFPREELLVLLRYLDNHPMRGRIRLLYGEPAIYATEEENDDDRWLTRGVKSVHPVPGFGGIQLPGHPKLLVIVLGHEGERTHISVRRHQPDEVILVPQGNEQHHEGLRQISERENQKIIRLYGEKHIWHIGLSSRGIVETADVILDIFKRYRYSHNIFVAPNGTKLQLIGVYLVARLLPEIQITYAVPALYNWERYSTGTGPLWEVQLEPLEDALPT